MGLITYLKETRGELKHVNWPSRGQAIAYTVLVIIVSVAIAVFLTLFDTVFVKILERFVS